MKCDFPPCEKEAIGCGLCSDHYWQALQIEQEKAKEKKVSKQPTPEEEEKMQARWKASPEERPKKVAGLGPIMYSIELRDLFAMAALMQCERLDSETADEYLAECAAEWSYRMADAMLAARQKNKPPIVKEHCPEERCNQPKKEETKALPGSMQVGVTKVETHEPECPCEVCVPDKEIEDVRKKGTLDPLPSLNSFCGYLNPDRTCAGCGELIVDINGGSPMAHYKDLTV